MDELENIIKNAQGSIENRLRAAYNLGKKDGLSGIEEIKAEIREKMKQMKHDADNDEWYSGKFSGLGDALMLINKKMEDKTE